MSISILLPPLRQRLGKRFLAIPAVVALTFTSGMSIAIADEISMQSDDILVQSALDDRRADNGTTPIAVQLDGRIYGARVTPYPYTADEDAIAGTTYYVDCSAAPVDASGSSDGDIEAGDGDQNEPAAGEAEADLGTAEPDAEEADATSDNEETAADTEKSGAAVTEEADAVFLAENSENTEVDTQTTAEEENSEASQGTGTRETPFTSLEAANALTLQPGDAVLFKGGSICTGTFTPQGSGTADAPITIDAYDAAKDNRARIDAKGADEALLLRNVQHYVIRNLELTNTAGDDTDYAELRYGLRVINQDQGTLTGFDVANLYVHDVLGYDPKDVNNSKKATGIRFEVLGGAVKSKFSGVEIAYNELRHVNRSGIVVFTDWWNREEAEYWGGSFYAQDPIHIHDNFLTDIGGDGIVVWAAPDSIIENNTLENAANEHGGRVENSHNAGIWAWVADRIIFRNNHVFDMHRSDTNNDGAAFDADTGGTNQVFEHNLTHDNDGGFMMYCGCWGLSTNITARYNISLNDGRFVDMVPKAEATGETARTVFMAGSTDSHFYNNTVLLPPTDVNITGYGHYMDNNVALVNNLYVAQQGTKVSDTTTGEAFNTLTWRNNIFGGPATGWPTVGTDNQVLPNVSLAAGTGLEKLKINVPEVLGTGYPVADPYAETDVTDFLGNPVPTVTNPDVGAFQYSAIPVQVTVADGGFEQCEGDAWGAEAVKVTDGQRSGSYALRLSDQTVSQTVKAAINRTYRVVAAVKGEVAVTVKLPSGAAMTLQPQLDDAGNPVTDASGYASVNGVFRTAADATNFTIALSGTGFVDDITAEGVEDLMVDGAFEAPTNTVWQPAIDLQGTPANSAENGALDRSEDAVTGRYAAPVPATGTRLNAAWKQEQFSGDAYNRFTYVIPGKDYELGVWAKAKAGAEVKLAWENFTGWRVGYPLTLPDVQGAVATSAINYERLSLPLNAKQSQIVVACQGAGLCDDMTLVTAWDGSVPAIAAAGCTDPGTGSVGGGSNPGANVAGGDTNLGKVSAQAASPETGSEAASPESDSEATLSETGSALVNVLVAAGLLLLAGGAGLYFVSGMRRRL